MKGHQSSGAWALKLWCPNFFGVFLLIKVHALIKPENIESIEIHWKPVRIVRLSDPLHKKGRLEMAPELKNLTYKSGARGAVRKTVASSFRPLLHKISNQESSSESEKEDKEDERRSISADSFDESDFSTQDLRGVYPRI